MVVNVTDKEGMLKLGFGKITKAGVLYKDQRIDWAEYVEIIGNTIICHFGTFELVNYETERDSKNKLLHMWTLKDVVTGKIYRIERSKVVKNKRLNPAWEVMMTETGETTKPIKPVVEMCEAFNFMMNKYKRPLAITYRTDEDILVDLATEILGEEYSGVFKVREVDIILMQFSNICYFTFNDEHDMFEQLFKKAVKIFHHDNGERPNAHVMRELNAAREMCESW